MKTLAIVLGLTMGLALAGNAANMNRSTQHETAMVAHTGKTTASTSGKTKKVHHAMKHHQATTKGKKK